MISVSHLHSVLPMPSRDDVFPHAEPVFNRTFMKRWSDQMVHPWRFYYLDLDRINACSEKTQCSMLVAEEYIKVSDFVKVKLGELQRRIQHASRQPYQQTSLANFIEFEQKLDDISAAVCDLRLFYSLHMDALDLLRKYLNSSFAEILGPLYSKDVFDQMVVQVCHLYDFLRTSRSLPESPPISPISLTGETLSSRRSQAWWVHADNSMNLMMHFLKYLSITTKAVDGVQDLISIQVTSIVLDNPALPERPQIIKVQWSNAGQEVLIKAMDVDDRRRSIRTKQKYLERWINKKWSLYNLLDKLRAQGHNMEDVESNAKYIQDLLDGGSTPVLRTVCNRVIFQSNSCPSFKITVDSNLMIQREHMNKGTLWFKSTEHDVQDFNSCNQDNMVRFPFDVVKISVGDGIEDLPHWWHELIQSKLLQQVPDVYNGIEGLAEFIKNDMSSLNAWVNRVQETADLKTGKAHIPSALTKMRERGSVATLTSNDSEGSTVVSISDYKTTDDCSLTKGSTTMYGAVDMELGAADSVIQSIVMNSNRQAFVRFVVYGIIFGLMFALLLLVVFFQHII